MQMATVTPGAPTQQMQVTVPPGVPIGGSFLINTPSGQMQVQAQVPEGQAMIVQVAAAPPVAVAQPVMAQPAVAAPPPVVTAAPVEGFPAQVTAFAVPEIVGIPVDPSAFVTASFGKSVDPVPMIDGQTAGLLAGTNKFKVKQRVAWLEGLTQGMCEQENVYDIFDDATGQPVFTAVEESDGMTRCCCAPHHSFLLKIKPAGVGVPREALRSYNTLMTMEREGCCSKWGLGCWACNDDCKDGFFMHAGDVHGEAGSIQMSSGRVFGYATQPKLGGGMTPTINVMERADAAGTQWGAMAKIEGPTCFGGCSELCCETEWPVSKMQASDIETKLMVGDFATITKLKPNSCGAAVSEAFTDTDQYMIEFKPGVELAPQQKALMLASLLQIDFMFFEKDNGMCRCENQKLKITLFECYCMGCTCPCNLEFDGKNNGGGGAPPTAEAMQR